jgi:hypothetical protein
MVATTIPLESLDLAFDQGRSRRQRSAAAPTAMERGAAPGC